MHDDSIRIGSSDSSAAATAPGEKSLPDWNNQRIKWRYLILALVLVVAICAGGMFYFHRLYAQARKTTSETLGTVAGWKATQIAGWIKERRSDAESSLNKTLAQRYLAEPGNAAARWKLLQWMTKFQQVHDYSAVVLFDSTGAVRLAVPDDTPSVRGDCEQQVQTALHSRDPIFVDLHRDEADASFHLSFLTPLGIKPEADQAADGVLMFQIDPQRFLYRVTQGWPAPHLTAETLLVRREGSEVVYLNEPRHSKGESLTMRFTVDSNPHLPAAMAVQGQEGIVDGVDYHGTPVLASLRKIPGTPWFMVAKVDVAEIYSGLHQQVRTTVLVTSLLLLIAILGVALLWRQQKLAFIKRKLAERQLAEDGIRKLNAQLEQRVHERTAELEAANYELEAFSYSVSHDLRAPLRAIDGFSQVLLEDCAPKLNDEDRGHLQRIRAATQRMGHLIDDLLRLSLVTRDNLRREPVDLTTLARSIVNGLQQKAPQRQAEFVIAPGLVAIGDEHLLQVVLDNLLENSWKFTSKHPTARIEVGYTLHNDQHAFFVRDDGAGFDMAHADKLFGAFQRVHNQAEFEGTGIGLAMVRRIVNRLGGEVWAQSAVEQGTTIYFTLQPKSKS